MDEKLDLYYCVSNKQIASSSATASLQFNSAQKPDASVNIYKTDLKSEIRSNYLDNGAPQFYDVRLPVEYR